MAKRKCYSADLQAKVTLEMIRDELTFSELSKKHALAQGIITNNKKGTKPVTKRAPKRCPILFVIGTPYGTRTRVTAVKGRRPNR